MRERPTTSTGMCYAASEAMYHMMGGKEAGLTPMHVYHEGASHWYLRWDTPWGVRLYIDPTADQFDTTPPWAEGTGRGFLTKEPSKTAQELMP